MSVVEMLVRGLDMQAMQEEEYVELFFSVLSEGERRGLLATGCGTHDPVPTENMDEWLQAEWDEAMESGEPPCIPTVWVLKP